MTLGLTIIILFVLFAIFDLVVGVTNNAVNFLNSAIGSQVASRRVILWVASAGLISGSFFASGMMDLANNGIIHSQQFNFNDLIAVFAGVMITNILLVDALNTHGFPTSTTTAFILELIGGALAITIYKNGLTPAAIGVVNTNQVFLILAGIFLSVFLAFILGTIIQFTSRILFSFRYHQRFGWLFAITGAAGVTVIVYLLIKQAFYTDMFEMGEWYTFITHNIIKVLLTVFAVTFFVMLLATSLFSVDIPRWVVLLGTFAMTMSFTSNDLVNFIGVPLVAIESATRQIISDHGSEIFKLGILNTGSEQVIDQGWYFLFFVISAIIMSASLFFSPKVQTVVQTEIYLERQGKGIERFEASYLSRITVRQFLIVYQKVRNWIPAPVIRFLAARFQHSADDTSLHHAGVPVYFDTIRASVNLVVSSSMIMIGTWYEVPLSTTFIIFMVSMGSSLADGAWGRENAVYRISGVITILGSWFLTSCIAIIGAFLVTLAICYGGVTILLILSALMLWNLYRSNIKSVQKTTDDDDSKHLTANVEKNQQQTADIFRKYLLETSKLYLLIIQGLMHENEKQLEKVDEKTASMVKHIKLLHTNMIQDAGLLTDFSNDSGHHLIQAFDYLSELSVNLRNMSHPVFHHVRNHHKTLDDAQRSELTYLLDDMSTWFNYLAHEEKEIRYVEINSISVRQQMLTSYIDELRSNQVKRLRSGDSHTRISLLYMDILSETKNIVLASLNVVNSHHDFVLASQIK
jgi:hypothetical protein